MPEGGSVALERTKHVEPTCQLTVDKKNDALRQIGEIGDDDSLVKILSVDMSSLIMSRHSHLTYGTHGTKPTCS